MKEQPNLSYIHQLSGGDPVFEEKLISIIKKEFPEEKARYFEHLEEKNYKLTAEDVHKLKHKISILGLEASYYLAETYENELLENELSKKNEFEEVLQSMQNFIDELK